jgi:hypothetical protein
VNVFTCELSLTKMPTEINSLANHEIVTVAVYLLGGESHSVDTEDIAAKANEIAPGRFSWRKYPEQINIETVRKRLWDAVKPEKGAFILGSERIGWSLTPGGLQFATKAVTRLGLIDLSRKRFSLQEKQWRRAERSRMVASDAYAKFVTGGAGSVTTQEAEMFFRIDNYVTGASRKRKLSRILNAFGSDPELGGAVRELERKVRGGE